MQHSYVKEYFIMQRLPSGCLKEAGYASGPGLIVSISVHVFKHFAFTLYLYMCCLFYFLVISGLSVTQKSLKMSSLRLSNCEQYKSCII